MIASDPIRPLYRSLQVGGRPHMGPGSTRCWRIARPGWHRAGLRRIRRVEMTMWCCLRTA